jgi:ubiquinone/menaquinone biosynthesis C-methylase UbiE
MTIEQKLLKNWTDNSSRYTNIVMEEINSFKKEAWLNLIEENIKGEEPIKILDVGCGPGFFSIILAEKGHDLTGIDYTLAMINEASANASKLGQKITLKVSDSQNLEFEDESFDLVISRNVAWTLYDAERAYAEWYRVLSPSGLTLIFDANWNYQLFNEESKKAYEKDLEEYKTRFPDREVPFYSDEMLDYRRSMPQCARLRPHWDLGALLNAGFSTIFLDMTIGKRIYDEAEQLLYRSHPMFLIKAQKK